MSKIEVDAIDKQSGSTLTLGGSGTAVTLACGATQTGFGRTGTVDWNTTPKTTNFTATSGDGFFVDTSSGSVTVTTPGSPQAGDIFSLADYTRTWQTNECILTPNSGVKIGGITADATLQTEGQSVTFVYVDATEGWINVQDSTSAVQGRQVTNFITATGGTITCNGDYKIHTFTGPGTFTVTNEGTSCGSTRLDYMVLAGGGGGGGRNSGGGGGAGGFRESVPSPAAWTASPIAATTGITAAFQSYPITVGGGGSGGSNSPSNPTFVNNFGNGTNGSNSIFSTITSTGGGAGNDSNTCSPGSGQPGGSGGGGGGEVANPGGSGNTPPVSPAQGTNGGNGGPNTNRRGGGGGGATAAGSSYPSTPMNGGAGATTSISATPTAYGGGGGGASEAQSCATGSGGTGGGANGLSPSSPPSANAPSASVNTGGGGGGRGGGGPVTGAGGSGGSGIVIIRYKYQ